VKAKYNIERAGFACIHDSLKMAEVYKRGIYSFIILCVIVNNQPGVKMEKMICPDCGTVGQTKSITPGNMLTECALWCLFLLPGMIYSVWRLSGRYRGCPSCKGRGMIPLLTRRGQRVLQEFVRVDNT